MASPVMTERKIDDPAAVLREMMRHSFVAFLRKAWPTISGGAQLQWTWHLDALCCALDRVRAGADLRLLVTLPPRNGKSKTISVIWVAWMLGRDPTRNFVCVSYSNELSAKMARVAYYGLRKEDVMPRLEVIQKIEGKRVNARFYSENLLELTLA